jgi:hypothetical protein
MIKAACGSRGDSSEIQECEVMMGSGVLRRLVKGVKRRSEGIRMSDEMSSCL